jgi:hypothetical protein
VNRKKILLCGLPESGKTTFLAALWYLLNNNHEIKTELSLGSFPSNREYLNRLAEKWCRFKKIDRTKIDDAQEIILHLKDETTEVGLHMPDMSGETWRTLWATRMCTPNAAEWSQSACGIMLFMHADKINLPIDIISRNELAQVLGEPPIAGDFASWSPYTSPTQVVLVDILQLLALPPLGRWGRRLAVIISAWDKAEESGIIPNKYLQMHLPMLHQFLQCSGIFSEVKVFGVSAQGGDLDSAKDTARLKDENKPSRRIRMVEDHDSKHDLTVPIKWLMV